MVRKRGDYIVVTEYPHSLNIYDSHIGVISIFFIMYTTPEVGMIVPCFGSLVISGGWPVAALPLGSCVFAVSAFCFLGESSIKIRMGFLMEELDSAVLLPSYYMSHVHTM